MAWSSGFSTELVFLAKVTGALGLIVVSRQFSELAARVSTTVQAQRVFHRSLADQAKQLGISRVALLAHLREQDSSTAAATRAAAAKAADTQALLANTAATTANTAAKAGNVRASGAAAAASVAPVVGGGVAAAGGGENP